MHLRLEKTLDVPSETLWALLGERFGDIGQWADAIIASRLDGPLQEGSMRTCELRPTSIGSGTIREEITVFDRDAQRIGFRVIDGLPGFMKHVENVYSVRRVSDARSVVSSDLAMRTAWYMTPMHPLIRRNFRMLVEGFIDELGRKAPEQAGPVEVAARAR